MLIKPTIGRVVWFWPAFPDGSAVQPYAAIITWVHSDSLVNLAVFLADGDATSATSVPLYPGERDKPEGAYCEWMPYQLGQAASSGAKVDPLAHGRATAHPGRAD